MMMMMMTIKATISSRWNRLFWMTSLSSIIFWFRSVSFLVHRETSIILRTGDHDLVYGIPTTPLDNHIFESQQQKTSQLLHLRSDQQIVTKQSTSSLVAAIDGRQEAQQKHKGKPHRRTIEKIYYIQTEPSRSVYMERWLSKQSKVPFTAIPVNNVSSSSQNNKISLFRHVASFVQHEYSSNRTMIDESSAVLIVQDNFKVFDRTLGRLERALKWLPEDFDVAQIDCFLTSSTNLVMAETRRDFVEIFQQDSWKGGMHAMIWRPSHLDRIQAFFSNKAQEVDEDADAFLLDCSTVSPHALRMYCLHFDNHHRVGCFHHWKASLLPDDSIQRGTSIVFPTSDDCGAGLKGGMNVPSQLKLELQLQLQLPRLPATSQNDDKERMAFHTSVVNVSGIEYTYRVLMPSSGGKIMESLPSSTAGLPTTTGTHHPTRLLLGICSANTNFVQRQAIRQTWGPLAWRTYFVVAGRDFDQVAAEFYHYQDLIWIDIEEHYKFSLTPKTMALLHFVSSSLMMMEDGGVGLDYVFKTDDDMFVNITQLHLDLSHPSKKDTLDYFGLPMKGTGPVRDVTSKFYLSPDEYSPELFPTYATGGGYALSTRFLECASREMAALPQMWWEDVAVGMLAEACGMELTDAQWSPEAIRTPGRYFQQIPDPGDIAIAHRVSIENQFRIHHGFRPVFDDDSYITPRLCPDIE